MTAWYTHGGKDPDTVTASARRTLNRAICAIGPPHASGHLHPQTLLSKCQQNPKVPVTIESMHPEPQEHQLKEAGRGGPESLGIV